MTGAYYNKKHADYWIDIDKSELEAIKDGATLECELFLGETDTLELIKKKLLLNLLSQEERIQLLKNFKIKRETDQVEISIAWEVLNSLIEYTGERSIDCRYNFSGDKIFFVLNEGFEKDSFKENLEFLGAYYEKQKKLTNN